MSTSDFSDLLRVFEDSEIRYLVVGGYAVDDFVTPEMVFQIGIAPVRIDILTGVTGNEFADAWVARARRPFLPGSAWFIGRDHLIRNKEAAGRPRDLIDLDELRLAARLRSTLPPEGE